MKNTKHVAISEQDDKRLTDNCIKVFKKAHPEREHSIISRREMISIIIDYYLE